jgi:hypothetical protein
MKMFFCSLIVISVILFPGCNGKGAVKKDLQSSTDTTSVSDTGYTGIKQYFSGNILVKEVTFKNGIRQGIMKSFYPNRKLRQTFWYENGLRADSAKWFYEEGQLFRSTPYKNDTVDGIQKQYFRNGRLKAKIGFKKGMRMPLLEEFLMDGKLVGGYPDLVVTTLDDYKTKGTFRISLSLSNKATQAKYYVGEFLNGVFDTAQYKKINTIKGIGNLDLRKTGSPKISSVGVIAETVSNYGNKYLIYKKIELPYKDLK